MVVSPQAWTWIAHVVQANRTEQNVGMQVLYCTIWRGVRGQGHILWVCPEGVLTSRPGRNNRFVAFFNRHNRHEETWPEQIFRRLSDKHISWPALWLVIHLANCSNTEDQSLIEHQHSLLLLLLLLFVIIMLLLLSSSLFRRTPPSIFLNPN